MILVYNNVGLIFYTNTIRVIANMAGQGASTLFKVLFIVRAFRYPICQP